MFSEQPLVSTCIASYNHAEYVGLGIESILAQTYKNHEIVVVDDGSSDNSLEILNSYAQKFPEQVRVFTHANHQNRGISITTNLAIEKSKGKFIALIGSDDVWEENKLALQVEILEQNPKVGIVYSKAKIIDSQGKATGSIIGQNFKKNRDQLAQILAKNFIPAPTVIFRRECFDRLGSFDETLVCSDWEMWLRILAHWEMAFIDEPLALYRVHQQNTSLGINAEIVVQRGLDVINRIAEKKEKIGGKLSKPEIQKVIQDQPARIKKEIYLAHLDNYFINCRYENFQSAYPHLLAAVKSSPLQTLAPRKFGAVVKHFILSLKNRSKSGV
jgi:alpha-1,3-rhamnosyltransferase